VLRTCWGSASGLGGSGGDGEDALGGSPWLKVEGCLNTNKQLHLSAGAACAGMSVLLVNRTYCCQGVQGRRG
jgi:hypothetical protein